MCTRLCAEPLCWASLCALPKLTLCLIKLITQATYCHFSNYYPNEAHCRYAGMQRLWLASLMGFFFVWDKNLMLLPAYVASGSNSFFLHFSVGIICTLVIVLFLHISTLTLVRLDRSEKNIQLCFNFFSLAEVYLFPKCLLVWLEPEFSPQGEITEVG